MEYIIIIAIAGAIGFFIYKVLTRKHNKGTDKPEEPDKPEERSSAEEPEEPEEPDKPEEPEEPEEPEQHTLFLSSKDPAEISGIDNDIYLQYENESSAPTEKKITITEENYKQKLEAVGILNAERDYIWHMLK